MTKLVYKIMNTALCDRFRTERICTGAPVDLEDGYIHLSDASQVEETAKRHFAGQKDLVLLAFSTETLGESLKWEPSRNKALFPHLYRPLQWEDILWCRDLPLGTDGHHDFSGLLT